MVARCPREARTGSRVTNSTGTIPDGLTRDCGVVRRRCIRSMLYRITSSGCSDGQGREAGCAPTLTVDCSPPSTAHCWARPSTIAARRVPLTPYLGAWRGSNSMTWGFDSRMVRNQDNELADRVVPACVWYDADLVAGTPTPGASHTTTSSG